MLATPATSQESLTSQDEDVLARTALLHYLEATDSQWVDESASMRTSGLLDGAQTEAMRVNSRVRSDLEDIGLPIIGATSDSELLSVVHQADGTLLAQVSISTIFEYGGNHSAYPESTWTDVHEIVIDESGASPIVLSDHVVPAPLDQTPGTPAGVAPTESSAERPSLTTSTPDVGLMSQPTLDIYSAQGYAYTWTSPPNAGDEPNDLNADFPRYENNCANFVSQVLRAGGWEYKGGVNPYDTDNWSPNLTGPSEASRTWSSAKYQYTFVRDNGDYTWLPNIWDALPGAVLYTDWDPNLTADGEIDHVMFVTYEAMGEPSGPLIAQKSPNRSNIPLAQSIANANAQGRTVVWYGLSG